MLLNPLGAVEHRSTHGSDGQLTEAGDPVAIDRSASKTAEDILKATALFGIFSFIKDRANLHYQCTEDVNLFAVLGAFVVAVAFFWLGASIIIHRIKDLYPWIFFGGNWQGILIYIAMMGLILSLVAPVGGIIMNTPIILNGSSTACN